MRGYTGPLCYLCPSGPGWDSPPDPEPLLCDRCGRPVEDGDEEEVEGCFYCPDCAEEVRQEMAEEEESREVERAKREIAEETA